jgi:V/A-type H+/Na+-transporting ATPase subunit D
MADNIVPTRSELMKLKNRIKLAKSGYNLLKKKRDGLILEFFEVLKRAKTLRKELTEEYTKALKAVNIARTVEGDIQIKSIAMGVRVKPEIHLIQKNIMGVVVPKIEARMEKTADRGFGLNDSSAMIDEASTAFENVVRKVIEAAEVETTMKKLLDEIEKTKRRVNALEFAVIPRLNDQKKYIVLRLEEMERENVFRLKRIKK